MRRATPDRVCRHHLRGERLVLSDGCDFDNDLESTSPSIDNVPRCKGVILAARFLSRFVTKENSPG